MATITFAEIAERVAAHRVTEAERNAPSAVACEALDALRTALAACTPEERVEILLELYTLAVDAASPAIAQPAT